MGLSGDNTTSQNSGSQYGGRYKAMMSIIAWLAVGYTLWGIVEVMQKLYLK